MQIRTFQRRTVNNSWFGRAFQWATSLLEAAITTRDTTQVFRNNEALCQLRAQLLGVAVDTVIFSNTAVSAEVGKSWYITEQEFATTRNNSIRSITMKS